MIIYSVIYRFIRNLIRLDLLVIMTKSISSNFIKYCLSRYFMIVSLLLCSYSAKSQEDETIQFYPLESFIPTPRIAI